MPFDWGSIFTDPNTGQNIWTNPTAGGLLGGVNPYQELGNLGTGILAGAGPSTTGPVTFGSALAKGSAYASERRDSELLNNVKRMQIASSAQETSAKAALMEALKTGKISLPGVAPEVAGALLASGNEGLLGHLIPQALTPEAQAQLAAGYPAIEKAQIDAQREKDLQGIEQVTSNSSINDALEAETIITRMEKGPVPPGGTAASLAAKLADPETGYIGVSPQVIAQAASVVLGKPMTEEQAAQWQTDWNRLNKIGAKFITDQRSLQAQQGATGGAGRQTDFGLSFIEKSNISPTVTGNANRAILKDFIQRQLDIAKVRGWTLDNTGRAGEALKRWDQQLTPVVDYSTGATTPGAAPAATPGSFLDTLLGSSPPSQGAAAPSPPASAPVQAGSAPAAAPNIPPPVTVSPPAPAQAPPQAPPPTPVQTTPINPDTGKPFLQFKYKGEGMRATQKTRERYIAPDPDTGELHVYGWE